MKFIFIIKDNKLYTSIGYCQNGGFHYHRANVEQLNSVFLFRLSHVNQKRHIAQELLSACWRPSMPYLPCVRSPGSEPCIQRGCQTVKDNESEMWLMSVPTSVFE